MARVMRVCNDLKNEFLFEMKKYISLCEKILRGMIYFVN